MKVSEEDKREIHILATCGNWPYEDIAKEYEISEEEVEQIVLSFTPPKAQ